MELGVRSGSEDNKPNGIVGIAGYAVGGILVEVRIAYEGGTSGDWLATGTILGKVWAGSQKES
jgi:hypothetical protein